MAPTTADKRMEDVRTRYVWLVYHQKEPYYGSEWSYIPQLRWGPSFIDRVVVGVYDSEEAADAAAYDYFHETLGLEESGDNCDDADDDDGYFYNAVDNGGCCYDLNERVFVSGHQVNPSKPEVPANDAAILEEDGRDV